MEGVPDRQLSSNSWQWPCVVRPCRFYSMTLVKSFLCRVANKVKDAWLNFNLRWATKNFLVISMHYWGNFYNKKKYFLSKFKFKWMPCISFCQICQPCLSGSEFLYIFFNVGKSTSPLHHRIVVSKKNLFQILTQM